jgi:hypothetical protein
MSLCAKLTLVISHKAERPAHCKVMAPTGAHAVFHVRFSLGVIHHSRRVKVKKTAIDVIAPRALSSS